MEYQNLETCCNMVNHLESLMKVATTETEKKPNETMTKLMSEIYKLHCGAIECQNRDLINFMLDKNFEVNLDTEKPHDTPLHLAILNDDVETVQKLLEKGADMFKENLIEENSFYLAVRLHSDKILGLLVDNISEDNITDEAYFKLLKDFLDKDYNLFAEKLLSKGFAYDVNFLTIPTNFFWAAVTKQFHRVVKVMIEHGVDVNFSSCNNDYFDHPVTALHISCENGDFEMVKLLLDNGAGGSVDKKSYFKKIRTMLTPLQTAIAFGHISVAEIFLDNGIDVNSLFEFHGSESSLLHLACESNQVEMIELLLKRGVDINIKNEEGFSAIFNCYEPENSSAFEYLVHNENFSLDDETVEHIIKNCIERDPENVQPIVNYLEKFGFQKLINEIDEELINDESSASLLIQATRQCLEEESIDALVYCGADVNVRNDWGRTAIFNAFLGRNKLPINKLLTYGADINLKCNRGLTPLDYALREEVLDTIYEEDDIRYDEPDLDDFDEFIELISQYLVKMRLLNLSVNEKNYESVMKKADDPDRHQKNYKKEVNKMKITVINNNVTYYDIVRADLNKMVTYLQDDVILETLKSESYQSEFPEFSVIISGCFYRGLVRKKLLDQVSRFTIFDIIKKLPYPCMRNIIDTFSNSDLRYLIYDYSVLM